MHEQHLTGGNTHAAISRVGDTVRRPTGTWTPGTHALLRHLEHKGFDGAPRVLGIDDRQREVLTFIPGDIVYPDHMELVSTDEGLVEVAQLIRRFHDAVLDFDPSDYGWSDRGSSGDPSGELICHNDLAPWNLVRTPNRRFVFIDWDLAAPGNRSWDLAWAILTFIPLMPDTEVDEAAILHRLEVFKNTYGATLIDADLIDVAVLRCRREAQLIETLGRRSEAPYDRLLAEGHLEIWSHATHHVAQHADRWRHALV